MSNLILFYDTETTGLPDWKNPSDSEQQPHLVQLAALLVNADTEQVQEQMDVIIAPDDWEWNESSEAFKAHGITMDRAISEGVPEHLAIEQFLSLWGSNHRVCYNRTFDQRIIRIALKRYSDPETMDLWADKDSHDCAMLMAKPIMQLPPKGRYGYRNPKLEAAYRHFTGKELIGAHNAMADARAAMEIYFAIKRIQEAA